MNILSWVVFGLLAGAIARLVVPGRQPLGCLTTLAVGVLGALIGGALGTAIGLQTTLWIGSVGALAGLVFLFFSPIPRLRTVAEAT